MTCAADLRPTAAETAAALVFTTDGYSDDAGVDHVTAAVRSVAAAEAHASEWEVAEAEYLRAVEASDDATALEVTATTDDLVIAHQPIHSAYLKARSRLMQTTALHWAAIGLKADAFLRMWGDKETSRYAQAAKGLAEAAGKIGKEAPADADPIDVMVARGHAERLCHYLANDEDGYRNWACCVGGVGRIAGEAEGITNESRDLAASTPIHRGLSGEIISAVWFGQSALLAAHEPPSPPTWAAQIRVLEAARAEAHARGVEVDAVYDDKASDERQRKRAEERYEAAQSLADAALDAIIDRPVASIEELVQKHQLGADRWFFGNKGETLSDPLFVARIAAGKDAQPSLVGRIHQDLQRLAGASPP